MKKMLFIILIILLSIFFLAGALLLLSDKEQDMRQEPKQTYSECVLEANNDYADSIKLLGTEVVIDGIEYSSLSREQWDKIDSDRLLTIEACQSA